MFLANSDYSASGLSNLPAVEADVQALSLLLEESFEVMIIRNSDNILEDVMDCIKNVTAEKKAKLSRLNFLYSGKQFLSDQYTLPRPW